MTYTAAIVGGQRHASQAVRRVPSQVSRAFATISYHLHLVVLAGLVQGFLELQRYVLPLHSNGIVGAAM